MPGNPIQPEEPIMTVSNKPPAARRPLLWACAGCAVVVLCVVVFLVGDGVYWYLKVGRQIGGEAAATLAPADLRAEWQRLPAGSAASGQPVFSGEAGCSGCHSLQPGVTIVGPSL